MMDEFISSNLRSSQSAVEVPGSNEADPQAHVVSDRQTVSPSMRPLKVGILAACPFPANHGSPGAIREMAEATADLGHEVHVVTYHFGEKIPLRGVHVHRVRPLTGENHVVVGPTVRKPVYDFQMIFKTLSVAKQYHLDVLHAHGYEAALVAACCKAISGLPTVFSSHSAMIDELASYNFIRPRCLANGLARVLDWFVPRLADRCVPHNRNIVSFFDGMGLAKRTTPIIDFGIDLTPITEAPPIDVRREYQLDDGPVVVYSGVMDHFQRLDLLLEAMTDVLREFPRATLLMLVTIPSEKHRAAIQAQAEALGISHRVVFTPPQPLERVGGLLKGCDVSIVPRPAATGSPIKLLNYMAAKCPCVMFESSSNRLTHLKNAYLASSDTGAALGEGIMTLLRDPDLRREIAENAALFVREHNDRKSVAEKVATIYTDLLQATPTWRRRLSRAIR
jgi:glycosyltransferase involved in cell wall biosynthesis